MNVSQKTIANTGLAIWGMDVDEQATVQSTVDVRMSKVLLSDNEKAVLLGQDVISPNSSSLTKSNQAMDGSSSFRITLSVGYSNSGGFLHLCKATGSYTRLANGSGLSPTGSQLYWLVTGNRYVNGSFVGRDQTGATKNYTSGGFSNVQLMPENVKYSNVTDAGVTYTFNATRGITIVVQVVF
ncbi:MAG: hypothetical protein U0M15_09175 [Bacillota bacterium]|nr:hypothetical protein [Bacillota bacterium]